MASTKRVWAGIVCLIALDAVLQLNMLGAAHAQSQGPEIITIDPRGSFAVPSDAGMTLNEVETDGEDLRFLLSGNGSVEVVEMDRGGQVQTRFELPVPESPSLISSFSVSKVGGLAIMGRAGRVDLYNSSGSFTQTVNAAASTVGIVFVDQTLFAVDAQSVTSLANTEATTFAMSGSPLLWPNLMFSLPESRLGIIEMGEAVLRVLDTKSGSWQRLQLRAPEIQGVVRKERTETEVFPPVFAAAVDHSSGHIYIAVSPFNVNQGAMILKFSADGVLLVRLRCTLPKSDDFKTDRNKDGHFSLSRLAVAGGRLFLISHSQKQCLYYDPV